VGQRARQKQVEERSYELCVGTQPTVGNARQVRVAPGGEIFVASPTGLTTGGGPNGQAAIMVLPDYDLDGVADQQLTFLGNLPNTQGLLFANNHFYYQDQTRIMRVPYATGDLKPSAAGEQVADITYYTSALHWPKPLDVADDGTIYVGNGGDQSEQCVSPHPFHGGIVKIDPAPGANMGGVQIAKGFRDCPLLLDLPQLRHRDAALLDDDDFTIGRFLHQSAGAHVKIPDARLLHMFIVTHPCVPFKDSPCTAPGTAQCADNIASRG